MNDADLLRLLADKLPHDLTAAERDLVRSRLVDSPQLREQVQSLHLWEEALGLSVDAPSGETTPPMLRSETMAEHVEEIRTTVKQELPLRDIMIVLAAVLVVILVVISALLRGTNPNPILVGPDLETQEPQITDPESPPSDAAKMRLAQLTEKANQSPDDPGADNPANDSASSQPKSKSDSHPKSSGAPNPTNTASTNSAGADASSGSGNAPAARPLPPPIVIEAESFIRGDVLKEYANINGRRVHYVYGSKKVGGKAPFAEYEIAIQEPGLYEVKLRYASNDKSSYSVAINGDVKAKNTVYREMDKRKQPLGEWQRAGSYFFSQGKNTFRLAAGGTKFVPLDQLSFQFVAPNSGNTELKPKSDVPPPWADVLALEKLPAFRDVCFDMFDLTKSLPRQDTLQKWFEPIADLPLKITDVKRYPNTIGAIEGTARLRAPIGDDTALRIAMDDCKLLQIHCYAGSSGASLVYYEEEGYRWVGYSTERESGAAIPNRWALTATDEGRSRRTEARFLGPLELRQVDGEVVLTRGDVALLRVPLEDPIEDVVFHGKAVIWGVGLSRTSDFLPRPVAPPLVELDSPAKLNWTEKVGEGGKFERLDDGAVRLVGNDAVMPGWVTAPLPTDGLHELILELDDVAPNAGLFLANGREPATQFLRFGRVDRGATAFVVPRTGETKATEVTLATAARCQPAAGSKVWVRLVTGCGVIRWALSVDGEHWGEWGQPIAPAPLGCDRFGLHHVADSPGCQMTLRKVSLRKLDALNQLADAALWPAAPSLPSAESLDAWNAEIAKQKPAAADLAAWRRTAALKTLAGGCVEKLGHDLIEALLDDPAVAQRSLAEQMPIAQQLLVLANTFSSPTIGPAITRRLHDVSWREFETANARPFTAVQKFLTNVGFGHTYPVPIVNDRAIRTELLQLLHANAWWDALDFCRELRFYHHSDKLKVVDWAETLARREAPGQERRLSFDPNARARRISRSRSDALSKQLAKWNSTLVEELSKETYNTLAELQAVLDSESYGDAAKMIVTLDPSSVPGVAPSATDERLLVSLAAAIQLTIDENPPLRESLDKQYASLAQLRVRQAIAAGNVAAAELAVLQFPSTEAAAEARRWLGDRLLSMGQFMPALAYYRRGMTTAGPGLRLDLQHRERLAAALLGQQAGSPATSNVTLGDRVLAASEFEAMVTDLRKRNASNMEAMTEPTTSRAAPAPKKLAVEIRARVEAPFGESPQEETIRDLQRLQVDWPGRQLATAVDGDKLLVSNRFQVSAYSLTDGKRQWIGKAPPGKLRKAREWTLIPFRPLVLPKFVVARQLIGEGGLLACWDKSNGDLVWHAPAPKESQLASDPWIIHGQLYALLVTKPDQQGSVLRLASFDPASGDLLTQVELMRLADVWNIRKVCEVTPLDDSFVAALGGITVCCDFSGNVRWVRKHVSLPPDDDETDWITQSFDRPLLVGDRLYLIQPGMVSVDCLDPRTGRLHWSRLLPEARRIVGHVGDQLILQTTKGFLSLAIANGEPRWRHAARDLLVGELCGGAGGIVYCQATIVDAAKKLASPKVVWLDPQTGSPRGETMLTRLEAVDPRLGPFVFARDRIWTFWGQGLAKPEREILELIPGEALK